MPDPRPNNEPRPRVEPQQSPSRPLFPDRVVGIVALVLGVASLVTFAVRLATSIGGTWLDTWWPLVAGVAFVALGAQRVRRSRHGALRRTNASSRSIDQDAAADAPVRILL